jgi:Holliday junction resolvase-like predicted endonuclease
MEVPVTLRRFKDSGRACTIAARLRACANIGTKPLTRSERWILSEWLVAQDRVSRFGERLIFHRERTPYAEVDLVFESPSRSLAIVEVKTWRGEIWGPDVISRYQLQRLMRARLYFESRFRRPTTLVLAVVQLTGRELSTEQRQIHYYDDWP